MEYAIWPHNADTFRQWNLLKPHNVEKPACIKSITRLSPPVIFRDVYEAEAHTFTQPMTTLRLPTSFWNFITVLQSDIEADLSQSCQVSSLDCKTFQLNRLHMMRQVLMVTSHLCKLGNKHYLKIKHLMSSGLPKEFWMWMSTAQTGHDLTWPLLRVLWTKRCLWKS